jgi:hypothetical protein
MTGDFVHKLHKNFKGYPKFAAKEMGAVKVPLIEEMDLRGMDGANMRSKDTSSGDFIITSFKGILVVCEFLRKEKKLIGRV